MSLKEIIGTFVVPAIVAALVAHFIYWGPLLKRKEKEAQEAEDQRDDGIVH